MAETDVPSAGEVRAQLAAILGSADFTASERLRKFLRYLVDEALAGRGELIKAYSIAIAVLDRDDSFDPNIDPVVRIEAGRLRRALERYYLVAGRADPIVVEIPKGAYVPHFTRRASEVLPDAPAVAAPSVAAAPASTSRDNAPTAQPMPRARINPTAWSQRAGIAGLAALAAVALVPVWRGSVTDGPSAARHAMAPPLPIVQVRAFGTTGAEGADAIAAGLTEELVTRLAALKEVAVTGEEPDARDHDATVLAGPGRFRLEGGVRVEGHALRVTTRLVDPATGTVLWSRAEDGDLSQTSVLATESRMGAEIAAAVAQPYGVVMRLERERMAAVAAGSDADAYRCTLRFYAYREAMSAARHAEVRGCLRRAVEDYPGFATAWAMLAWLEIDEDRFELGSSPGPVPALARALDAARRAVAMDPDNPRAPQALMMALFLSGASAEGMRVGEAAIAAHPGDADLVSEFGLRVALAGDIPRGMLLMRQGLAGNPARGGHYCGTLAVMAYLQGDYRGALAELRQSDQQGIGMYYLFAAMSYAQLDMMAEAHEAAARFLREQPQVAANIDAELDRRGIKEPARSRIVEGMRLAGMPVKGNALVHNDKPVGREPP